MIPSSSADVVSGGAICCSFIVFGAFSVLLYKPWRRRIDRNRHSRRQPQQLQEYEGEAGVLVNQPRLEDRATVQPEKSSEPAQGLEADLVGAADVHKGAQPQENPKADLPKAPATGGYWRQ